MVDLARKGFHPSEHQELCRRVEDVDNGKTRLKGLMDKEERRMGNSLIEMESMIVGSSGI